MRVGLAAAEQIRVPLTQTCSNKALWPHFSVPDTSIGDRCGRGDVSPSSLPSGERLFCVSM